jgi:chromosome segregation ATPase
MNAKVLSILLVLACLGLGAALYVNNQQAQQAQVQAVQHITELSNQWVAAEGKLSEEKQVNAALNTQITQRTEEAGQLSNKWTSVAAALDKATADAKAAADAARSEIAKRDGRITELEGEKDDLTKKMDSLNADISGLNSQIKETQRKLAASEGDRAGLQKELKRLLAEKAELERKFNDLAVLREQVSKLREELAISHRLDFIRRGLYAFSPENKGGPLLQRGIHNSVSSATNATLSINAETSTAGGAKATVVTNAPAKK